jgi:hypothetical protein
MSKKFSILSHLHVAHNFGATHCNDHTCLTPTVLGAPRALRPSPQARIFYPIPLFCTKLGTVGVLWGRLYGTRMETNVFVFTLFFSFPSLFSWYDIVQGEHIFL